MSSCCGACGGQDTAPKKDKKLSQAKEGQTKEEQAQGVSKPGLYIPETSKTAAQKQGQ